MLPTFADKVNNLGLTRYPNLYAGCIVNRDRSVTIYLGPGPNAALIAAVRTLGPTQRFTVVRVRASMATLNAAARALERDQHGLAAAGLHVASSTPDPKHGSVDVTFASVPAGMSTEGVTSLLRHDVSPYLTVTSTTAPKGGLF